MLKSYIKSFFWWVIFCQTSLVTLLTSNPSIFSGGAISFKNFSSFSSLKMPYIKSWKILVNFSLIGGHFMSVFPNSWSISSSYPAVALPMVSTVFKSVYGVELLFTVGLPWKLNAFCIRAVAWFSDMLFRYMRLLSPPSEAPSKFAPASSGGSSSSKLILI